MEKIAIALKDFFRSVMWVEVRYGLREAVWFGLWLAWHGPLLQSFLLKRK